MNEKMYTREDVVRLLAGERDRCLAVLNQKYNELERIGRQKPAVRPASTRAAEKISEAMKAVLGTTPGKGVDYKQMLLDVCERDWFGDVLPVNKELLEAVVFPSDERTIEVVPDQEYGGAHCYIIRECRGFKDGKTEYVDTKQVLQFIQKEDDGTVIPGLQSEQVVLALIDRHKKLNARFPSAQNEKMIQGLEMFLEASRERVQERMSRGVMGELQK